jgi:hypothetical protein
MHTIASLTLLFVLAHPAGGAGGDDGTYAVYDLTQKGEGEARIGGDDGNPIRLETGLTGHLRLTLLAATGSTATVHVAVTSATAWAKINGEEAPDAPRLQGDLARGCESTLARGLIRAIRFPPGASPLAMQMMKHLVAAVQVAQPEPEPVFWTREEDPGGVYFARYRLLKRGPGRHITLRRCKADYPVDPAAAGTEMQQIIPVGAVTRAVMEGPLPVEVVGKERLLTLSGPRVVARSYSTITLRRTRIGMASRPRMRQVAALFAGPQVYPLSADLPDGRDTRPGRGTRLTPAELIQRLDRLSNTDPRQREAVLRAVREMAHRNPAALAQALPRWSPEGPAAQAVASALAEGGGGGPALLCRAIRTHYRRDEQSLQALLPALGLAETPGEPGLALLEEVMESRRLSASVTSTAALALGVAARHLRKDRPLRAEELGRHLGDRLQQAHSLEEQITYLLALGNAGQGLSLLRPYLAARSPLLRAQATHALRFNPEAPVEGLLAQALSDRDPGVRLEAVEALHCRPMSPKVYPVALQALACDPEDRVRLAVAGLLFQGRDNPRFPAIEKALRKAAAQDHAPTVRVAIQQMLTM